MNRLLLLAVGLFLAVFMALPILSLVLMSLTGQPVSLANPFEHGFSLQFYSEFFVTRRYRLGLLDSVGFAPLCAVLVFLAFRLVPPGKGVDRAMKMSMAGVFLGALAFAVLWPVLPGCGWGHDLVPGKHPLWRLMRAVGYCPMVALLATTVGVSVAFCLTRTRMPGRQWFRVLCILPMALPTFLGALAFKNLLGEHGIVTRLLESMHIDPLVQILVHAQDGPLAAGFVQVFLFFPLVVLTTAAALDRIDPSLAEAAGVMGSTREFTFWTVSLPVIMPGITAGAFLVFVRSFGDFAALQLLMPIRFPMIVLEAYRDMSGAAYWGGASMLASVMIGVILVLLAMQKYFVESGTYQTVTGRSGAQGRLSDHPAVRYGALFFVLAVFSVPLSFLGATVLSSFAKNWGADILPRAYTISRYTRALSEIFEENSPLFNSFGLVIPALLGTTCLSFTVAFLISRGKKRVGQLLDFVCMLPFVLPGVAFAVALIGAFNRPPLELHGTVAIVVLAYMVTRVPYGVRSTLASFQQIGSSMEESSKTMGGTPDLTLGKVTVPLVLPGVIAGAIMVFISCMEDVAITSMCCPPRWYPASIYVFHQIDNGNLFEASAYGVILMCLTLVPYLIVQRLGGVKGGL